MQRRCPGTWSCDPSVCLPSSCCALPWRWAEQRSPEDAQALLRRHGLTQGLRSFVLNQTTAPLARRCKCRRDRCRDRPHPSIPKSGGRPPCAENTSHRGVNAKAQRAHVQACADACGCRLCVGLHLLFDTVSIEPQHQALWVQSLTQHDLILWLGINPLQIANRGGKIHGRCAACSDLAADRCQSVAVDQSSARSLNRSIARSIARSIDPSRINRSLNQSIDQSIDALRRAQPGFLQRWTAVAVIGSRHA